MNNIKSTLTTAALHLAKISNTAQLDAEVLLAHLLQKSRSFLYTHPEVILSSAQQITFQDWILKRTQGYPIAYLTQTREFWSLPLAVSPATLIPRPETELLVELTLNLLTETQATILDLGTGSGAIALALAHERPEWHIVASDISTAALEIAQYNATQLNLENITFHCSDWFTTLPSYPLHAIIANPPYIEETNSHLQQGDVFFEPRLALIADNNGLAALQHIITYSKNYLLSGGWLLVEHGYNQKEAVDQLFKQAGYQDIYSWQDFQGHDRVTAGRWLPN